MAAQDVSSGSPQPRATMVPLRSTTSACTSLLPGMDRDR
jgi:hypothetical protein